MNKKLNVSVSDCVSQKIFQAIRTNQGQFDATEGRPNNTFQSQTYV